MAAAIDMLDNCWNPQQVLRAMQTERNRMIRLNDLRTGWDDFIIPRFDRLDQSIVLKRLGLEETACIVGKVK